MIHTGRCNRPQGITRRSGWRCTADRGHVKIARQASPLRVKVVVPTATIAVISEPSPDVLCRRSTRTSFVLVSLSWLRRRSESRSYGRPLQRRLLALPHGSCKNVSNTELHIPQAVVSTVRWPLHVTWAGSCCLSLCGVSVEPGSKVNDTRGRCGCARLTALRSLPAVTLHESA